MVSPPELNPVILSHFLQQHWVGWEGEIIQIFYLEPPQFCINTTRSLPLIEEIYNTCLFFPVALIFLIDIFQQI